MDVCDKDCQEPDIIWVCSHADQNSESVMGVREIESRSWREQPRSIANVLSYADGDLLESEKVAVEEWYRKLTRINAKVTYQLQKLYLFMDELEGFARMLSTIKAEYLKGCGTIACMLDESQIIGGDFQFDPRRVFDTMLALIGSDFEPKSANQLAETWALLVQWHIEELFGFRMLRCATRVQRKNLLRMITAISSSESPVPNYRGIDISTIYHYLFPDNNIFTTKASVDKRSLHDSKMVFLNSISITDALTTLERPLRQLLKLGVTTHALPDFRANVCVHIKQVIESEIRLMHRGQLPAVVQAVFFLGPNVCCHSVLTEQLLRYLLFILETSADDVDLVDVLLSKCIMPGLALLRPNPVLCDLVWKVLCYLPFSKRSKIYAYATDVRCVTHMKRTKESAARAIQRVLRRLSNENVKDLGRKLGKLALSNPLSVSSAILQQVQAYPNMIDQIVHSLKYCNMLMLDTLLFFAIRQFSDTKPKLKEDGQNISRWFSALCTFCGALYRRYHHIELSSLLQYILKSVNRGQVLNLLILKELVSKLTRIDILRDMSMSEVHRAATGELFRNYSDHAGSQKGPAYGIMRLKIALENGHHTIPLLLTVAKCRQEVALKTQSSQTKFISQLSDECHVILLQYISFIQQAYTTHEYRKMLPSFKSLVLEHKIDTSIAFHVYRPVLLQVIPSVEFKGDSVCIDEDLQYWGEVTKAVQATCSPLFWEIISPELYMAFWTFDIQSIYVPKHLYAKLGAEASVDSSLTTESTRMEQKCSSLHDAAGQRVRDLAAELKSLLLHYADIRKYLQENMSRWVVSRNRTAVVVFVLQNLVFLRSKVSHADALYSAVFVDLIGRHDSPGFSILHFYDRLLLSASQSIYACSELESKFFAIFMVHSFEVLSRWRSKDVYERECWSLQEFRSSLSSKSCEDSFRDFLKVLYKWEHRLTKGMLQNLDETDYMQIANSFSVLIMVVSDFPITKRLAEHIHRRVKKINTTDRRGDIVTISTRYLSLLNTTRRKWISTPYIDGERHGP
ncbi:THO complex, subunitTHOC2, N-terminal [Ostreococcus tauri]|uniref:THO complex subunit 2 n=1 Tax=Ostreococcus tauri TaxID=70448 RepID=A0A090M735_OSTTA|nr:THO complex, subunitTHOC2, N-terminal [Ostreococcus tauri]CEG00912.1 THO complex, subunitTHOC2, N-terminal [Ostreococcus tauri]|eukprot:XP_022840665.1 THO complex, subunitTHOC2, N-terminal [Ostreococcus tauri]